MARSNCPAQRHLLKPEGRRFESCRRHCDGLVNRAACGAGRFRGNVLCPRVARLAGDRRASARLVLPLFMCSGSSVRTGWSGTPSTGCLTGGRSRGRSGRRGAIAAHRRSAGSRSAPRRRGCATSSSRRAAVRCPAWSGRVRRSLMRRPSGCASSGRTERASHRQRLPLGVEGASAAGVRGAAARVDRARAGRCLAPWG